MVKNFGHAIDGDMVQETEAWEHDAQDFDHFYCSSFPKSTLSPMTIS